MPFIGRDWRSPGEAWVKTESLGWQRMKIIESQLYPGCHQNPACSWPPKSDFGQHMARHCKKHEQNNSQIRNNSLSSSCSDSDSNTSRAGSTSPSPTCSPEKSVHHLYPLTISSPYGKYSCCSHHKAGDGKLNAQVTTTMSRSLSRESVELGSSNLSPTVERNQKMRYNNSVSDFRATSSKDEENQQHNSNLSSSNVFEASDDNEQAFNCNQQSSEFSSRSTPPLIMKNGCMLDDTETSIFTAHHQGDTEQQDLNMNEEDKRTTTSDLQQISCCCCSLNNICSQSSMCQQKDPYVRTAPHCRISVKTREVAMYNTISEAFYRLDFCNAIHDIRRFNYICKLLHLLITQNLTSLSGCATKVLFTMLEQVAWEVSSNKRNIHVLKNLLNELKQIIQKNYCWGRPIGSSLLWQQHFDTIERISQIVDGIELSPPKSDNAQITFNSLPVEMIREILLRLNDYRDLVSSAQASPVMRTMVDGQYIWRQLCKYHFTEQQLKTAIENYSNLVPKKTGSSIRGIKYAKTTTADGKKSFRNPILHKSETQSSSRQQKLDSEKSNENRQRGSQQAHQSTSDTINLNDENQLPSTSKSFTSHVTRAIRIFDKETGSTINIKASKKERQPSSSSSSSSSASGGQNSKKSNQTNKDQKLSTSTVHESHLVNSSQTSHDINWERVFHQLRKKFDLKEEYADCLLLCRHCRCLFWKSFGHPCIRKEDSTKNYNNNNNNGSSSLNFEQNCSLINNHTCDGINCNTANDLSLERERSILQAGIVGNEQNYNHINRPSVAALSRNFDNRALRSNRAYEAAENVPPPQLSAGGNNNQPFSEQHSFSDNLSSQQRNINIRLAATRRQNEDYNQRLRENRHQQQAAASSGLKRIESLVPEHVAISPQAFLKFFSL